MTLTVTLTLTQTGTPTVSPQVMRYQCLEVADKPSVGNALKDVIVYNGDANLHSWLSDQETNDTYVLPREADDTLWQFEVSPDRQYLKYVHSSARTQEDRLMIATSDGQPIWSRVIGSTDWDWFDNKRLVSYEFSEDGTHRLLLLNPFNGEQKRLLADFPDSEVFSPDRWAPLWYQASRGLPLYDPTLSRALYPAIDDKRKSAVIILWDTTTNQKVGELVTQDDWGDTPIWTSDGAQFIIATSLNTPKEFFAVSRDGVVRQITHFADSFTDVDIPDSYSLSPNGKLVAFWITAQPSPYDSPRLAVLDIKTGEAANYCIQGDPFADNAMEPSPPIWSPDGTQLLVISRIPEDTKVRRVVVVDILHNYAAQIDKDMEPVGWMVAP